MSSSAADKYVPERNENSTSVDTALKITKDRAVAILIDSDVVYQETLTELQRARELAGEAGLSIESYIVKPVETTTADSNNNNNPTIYIGNITNGNVNAACPTDSNSTTGGHSNTDHVVMCTGNVRVDRIAELKRNLLRRHRAMQPEQRRDERWDKQKALGGRRRRILREQDINEKFPSEPPANGWVIFVGQMTTKIRHDRQDEHHDQSKVLQELGKIWRVGMSAEDRKYYTRFAQDARKEFEQQVIEFRATGSCQPSKHFAPLENSNIWIRKDCPNPLEKEIHSYETIRFPLRPPEFDEEYEERELRSVLKRKLKGKGFLEEDGRTWKKGIDFEALVEKEKKKRLKQNK